MEDKETLFRVPTLLAEERRLGLAILRVGHSQVRPSYKRLAYYKTAYTLKVIAEGCGTIRSAAGEWQMKAGDVVLYWQGHVYEWWTDPNDLLRHYWMDLEGEAVVDMFRCLATPADCVLPREKLPEKEPALFEQLLDLFRRHPPHYIWKSLAVFFDIWHSVTESVQGGRRVTYSPAHKAKEFIDTHYMVSIGIDDVAHFAGVTPQYLANVFKRRYGIAPHEYIINCRLQAAARLLQDGISVRKAATAVGYNDPNYFARLFHKHMGVAPSSLIGPNRQK